MALVDSLFRGCWLESRLWTLLFQPKINQADASAVTRSGSPIVSWQIDWSTSDVEFCFTRAVKEEDNGKRRRRHVASKQIPVLQLVRYYNRFFTVQSDGYLCGTHSLNTLARCIVLNPAATFETMLTMRTIENVDNPQCLYALREEITIAALREGVVLGSVVLSDDTCLQALCGRDAEMPHAENKSLENTVQAAGGMMVLFSSGQGMGGHYITIVPLGRESWAVYDTDSVVDTCTSLGAALELAFVLKRTDHNKEVVGLVPLDRTVDLFTEYWYYSTLQNTSVSLVEGRVQVNSPVHTPFALHGASIRVQSVLGDSTLALPDVNVFTYATAQNKFETEINEKVEEIASHLATRRSGHIYSQLNWSVDATLEMQKRLDEVPLLLTQLSSLLRSWIGLLFVSKRILADRDWLRYVTIHYVARALRDVMRKGPVLPKHYRLAAAITVVSFVWHKFEGLPRAVLDEKYVNVCGLVVLAKKLLTFNEVFGSIGTTSVFEQRANMDMARERSRIGYLARNVYDRSLWLLYSAYRAEVLVGLKEESLRMLDSGVLDDETAEGVNVPALTSLRELAFRTPSWESTVDTDRRVSAARIADSSKTSAMRLRELAAPRFSELLVTARQSSFGVTTLLQTFGISPRYEVEQFTDDMHAAIERDADTFPHMLEAAFVMGNAMSMYGTVFDCKPSEPVIDPNVPLSQRVLKVESDGAALSSYIVRNDLFANCKPFDEFASVQPVLQ